MSVPTLQAGTIDVVVQSLDVFVQTVIDAIPVLITGLTFLLLAAVLVKLLSYAVRIALRRALPGKSPIYVQFVTTVVAVFLWFAVALSFLSIVGLGEIAASLGTAAGFVALGVSYAISGMIKDAVAGIYLIQDPDFDPGDVVTVGDVTGVVHSIELRKTRLEVDGDRVVMGNAKIEERWTRES